MNLVYCYLDLWHLESLPESAKISRKNLQGLEVILTEIKMMLT